MLIGEKEKKKGERCINFTSSTIYFYASRNSSEKDEKKREKCNQFPSSTNQFYDTWYVQNYYFSHFFSLHCLSSLTICYFFFFLGYIQVSFIPPEMSIAYPMFSSTRMHQQIQVEKMRQRSEERRVGKECISRWSPYH